ncbi:MAG: hypothetical protein KKD39_07190 [Candidatus Altiarchaeota archaeon]|nr:hypothetical protein [Candidatus Altiarchaeota archaeon]
MGEETSKPPKIGELIKLPDVLGPNLSPDVRELLDMITPEAVDSVRSLLGRKNVRFRDALFSGDVGQAVAKDLLEKVVTKCLSIPSQQEVSEGDVHLLAAMMGHPFVEYRESAISVVGVIIGKIGYDHPIFNEVAGRLEDPEESIRISALHLGRSVLDHRRLPDDFITRTLQALDGPDMKTKMWAARVIAKAVGRQELPAEARLKLYSLDTGNNIVQGEIHEALLRDKDSLTKPGIGKPEPIIESLVEVALSEDPLKSDEAKKILASACTHYGKQVNASLDAKINDAKRRATLLGNLKQTLN